MSVAVEIVPPGETTVGATHHLDTLLTAFVVVRLSVTPVGVRQRRAVTPGISFKRRVITFSACITQASDGFHYTFRYIIPTSLYWVVLEADPLAAAFAVQRQKLFFLLIVDADQISSSGDAVLMCSSPALLHGPVHIVEEL